MNKPVGGYTWWAIDNATKRKSNEVSYGVVEAATKCVAPKRYHKMFEIKNPTCRDLWNFDIFYSELYHGWIKKNQDIIYQKIQGTLETNQLVNIGIDVFSSISSVYDIKSLKQTKDIETLFLVGSAPILEYDSQLIGNEYADIWLGALSAGIKTVAEGGNPVPVIEYALTTGFSTINNLIAVIKVSTLTKQYQEMQIAKQFLYELFLRGSRMPLVAIKHGLPSRSPMEVIVGAIAEELGATNPWYWFDDYDTNNVVNNIMIYMNVTYTKQAEYTK